jgi:hypothetical protein
LWLIILSTAPMGINPAFRARDSGDSVNGNGFLCQNGRRVVAFLLLITDATNFFSGWREAVLAAAILALWTGGV